MHVSLVDGRSAVGGVGGSGSGKAAVAFVIDRLFKKKKLSS